MIKRQHVVPEFFDEAEAMRGGLDASFGNPYEQNIRWQYFCDPGMYTYLRATPKEVFTRTVLDRFLRRLRDWCVGNLGLVPMNVP